MNLEPFLSKEWYREHVDACPAYTEMTAAGFTSALFKSKFSAYSLNLCFYKDDECDWFSLVSDQKKIGSRLIKSFISEPKMLLGLHQRWQKNFQKMLARYYKFFPEDLSKLSDRELIQWERDLINFYKNEVEMPGFIDGFMFYADRRLDYLLRNFCNKRGITNHMEIMAALSAQTEPSFINEEELGLKKIAARMTDSGYKVGANLPDFLNDFPQTARLVRKHLFKYSWVKSSYVGFKEYTNEMFGDEIDRLLNEPEARRAGQGKKNKVIKDELIKKYQFTKEIIAIAELTELFVKWQDQRKMFTLTFVSLRDKVVKEVSRRWGVDYKLLKYALSGELQRILLNQFDVKELERRLNGCLCVHKGGEVAEILTGNEARKVFQQVSRIGAVNAGELSGVTASLGKAAGRARIIMSAKDIGRVNSGDILVAPMTRPEHLPGMRKAAAIVTDDGGITCHAAIVSRELGIPCIIGTRVATQVLKDGEMVEVDANKGIIRKVEV